MTNRHQRRKANAMENEYFPWPSTDIDAPMPEGWNVYLVNGEKIEAPSLREAIICWNALNEGAS